jgi:DNA polymerase-3 subunit alpha
MSASGFVHLHLHTQYSLLQGAIRIKPLMKRLTELGMPACAMTDSHNMFGAVDFYLAAKESKIQPILGCEVLMQPSEPPPSAGSPGAAFVPRAHPMVLLVKDLKGYQNLCAMLTRSSIEAAEQTQVKGAEMHRPWVTRENLKKHSSGLVCLSGDIKGEISYRLVMGQLDLAEELARQYQKIFGEDFFLELVDSGLPEQEHANELLHQMGQKLAIPVVATSNCHYLEQKDAESHELLQCIESGKNLDFDRPKSLAPAEFYLKDAATMRERMERFPGACDATLEIARRCTYQFKFKDDQGKAIYHLPDFRPEGVSKEDSFDLTTYFKDQARMGLKRRLNEPFFEQKKNDVSWVDREEPRYWERLEGELAMIEKTGFAGYFLIVSDFINWAKEQDIPVGPGRGSGAGSLVAYSLRITDIDPISYNLLFERFINPERISMPDFDIDFCQDRRGEVIDYVTRRYGKENVSQIITFGKLQARAVLKDVGRVLGLPFADTDQITKLLPDELNIKLSDAMEKSTDLRAKIESEPRLAKIMEYALKLEGLSRSAGVHAAGVIITEKPIQTYAPLFVGSEGVIVTQYDKDFSEKIGLIKYDFLGLKTLTVISNAVRLVRQVAELGTKEAEFVLERIHYDDPHVYALVGSGDTDGIFQVESSGMKDLCLRLQPNSIEDLTAINALYRPGPLGSGMVDDFIDRKHGRKPIEYDDPRLESILKDTYGVILYQEQVMQIARELAGYTLGQADMLRRAMGKKKPEEMAEHRQLFLQGAAERGLALEKSGAIFDLMAKFAEYGFNKSHSAAYAILTYQTAYLKHYFPAEFMAALMTTEVSNTDKITKYISNARQNGIRVLPPDVNFSGKSFSVERQEDGSRAIRFGMEGIKGVGGVAVDVILESRRENGRFANVLDFVKRVPTRKVNKKVLESLNYAGAFDSIAEVNRPSLHASLEALLEHASDDQEEKALGQSSLFDQFQATELKVALPTSSLFKQEPDWPQARKFAFEKQAVGFYVSGHPMENWQKICADWLGWSTERLKAQLPAAATPQPPQGQGAYQRPKRAEIQIAGLLTEMREVTTKKGTRMAFVQLEDLDGKVEVIVFPDAYQLLQERLRQAIAESEVVVVSGELEVKEEGAKILAKSLEWAKDAHKNRVQQVVLKLQTDQVSEEQLRELKRRFLEHRGKCPVMIHFHGRGYKTRLELPKTVRVSGTPQMVASVNQIFGTTVVDLH